MSVTTLSREDRDLAYVERVLGSPTPVTQDLGCVRSGCTRHAQWKRPGLGDREPRVCTRHVARSLRRKVTVQLTKEHRALAHASAVADVALRRWAALPSIAGVRVSGSSTIGVGLFRRGVSVDMQLSTNPLSALARWAQAFDASVRFLPKGTYVDVSTETVVDGVPVVVWTHVTPEEFPALATRLGVPVPPNGEQVEVTAANVLTEVSR